MVGVIVIEGSNCVGKSTLIDQFRIDQLKQRIPEFTRFKFPTTEGSGDLFRRSPTDQKLAKADILEHVDAIKGADTCLIDRFILSNQAYMVLEYMDQIINRVPLSSYRKYMENIPLEKVDLGAASDLLDQPVLTVLLVARNEKILAYRTKARGEEHKESERCADVNRIFKLLNFDGYEHKYVDGGDYYWKGDSSYLRIEVDDLTTAKIKTIVESVL